MTINNIHISEFNGVLLGHDISPPDIKNSYFKADNFSFPILYNTDIGLPGLTVRLVFESNTNENLIKNLSKFRTLCHKQSEIRFDDNLIYDCIYLTEKFEKMTETFYKVTISFACVIRSELLTKTIMLDDNIIYNNGTHKAPCRLILTNNTNEDMQDVKVNDIVIKSIPNGKTIIIDGIKKTVTMDGLNVFNIIDMTEFPCLEVGENVLEVSCQVKVEWLNVFI